MPEYTDWTSIDNKSMRNVFLRVNNFGFTYYYYLLDTSSKIRIWVEGNSSGPFWIGTYGVITVVKACNNESISYTIYNLFGGHDVPLHELLNWSANWTIIKESSAYIPKEYKRKEKCCKVTFSSNT